MSQVTRKFALAGLAAVVVLAGRSGAADPDDSATASGRDIAFDRNKGNCLACHVIGDGELPGNIAPPLVAMKQRFPDRAVLRAQISDPMARNPETVMPPYGRHKILSDEEIELVMDYLYTL